MGYDIPAFTDLARGLGIMGRDAGAKTTTGVANHLGPMPATSPLGNEISLLSGGLQLPLTLDGEGLSLGADGLATSTQNSMTAIDQTDLANAGKLPKEQPGRTGKAGGKAPGELKGDAAEKAGKSPAEQLQQLLSMASQSGGQLAQMISQPLSQIGQQVGQLAGQASQQIGQLAGKASESLGKPDVAAPELGLDEGLGAGGAGGGGAGAGGGGIGGAGITTPAGLSGPIAPMTTSSAVQPSTLQPPATGTAGAGGAAARTPFLPFMPMHGLHRNNDNGGEGTKRDPAIFPESPLFDLPKGVEQNYGANPEIVSEEPPFGTAESV